MARNSEIYENIHRLREKYYLMLPGKESLLQMIGEAEVSEQVYNSNAIENNTLTLDETEKVLLDIKLDRSVEVRELFEARNLSKVLSYINRTAPSREVNRELILALHEMLLSNINDEIAGRFRQPGEYVRVGSHIAPAPEELEHRMEQLIIRYLAMAHEHIAKRVSRFHLAFESTHPFLDGNGRIGRVLNNYLLIREGYIPINIRFIDRSHYYEAFNEYHSKGSTEKMDLILCRALSNSYHKRLAYMEGKRIIKLSEYAKESGQSHSNLLNKAKRQTIEAFTERGVWKIGVPGQGPSNCTN